MKKLKIFICIILTLSFSTILLNCHPKTDINNMMNEAEFLMQTKPDSSLTILSSIDFNILKNDADKARYALLMSIALDKNFIDTTNFNVLQPAIDYYFENGTYDEKLKTYYYQGRIYQNRNDFNKAMVCFLKAKDLKDHYTDTLTYANMLVAQGQLYFRSYQIDNYIKNNLEASDLYYKIKNENYRQSSLIKALDGCIASHDKHRSDSIMAISDSLVKHIPESQGLLTLVKLTYKIVFDSRQTISEITNEISNIPEYNDEIKLNLALGYLNRNEAKKARCLFETIDKSSEIGTSLKYMCIKPEVLEANKQYPEAIAAYKKYHEACEAENNNIYLQKTTVAQEQHELELKHLYSIQRKDRMLLTGLVILFALVVIIGISYYQLHLGKTKQIIAEKEKSRLQLENDNLQKQNAVLELQKHNAELECERQNLTAENMQMKISQLESEKENLRTLMKENELSDPVRSSIQERIEMLNGLLAAHISDNTNYSKPYDKWIEMVTQDRKRFMDSTRLAFKASHPAFMKYLEDHGLDESELNYVCLYAIGLRGKEIGEYIRLKRHYHMSSDIRKKLDLHEDDTNLGIYIRNLMKTT